MEQSPSDHTIPKLPSEWRAIWLIGRRAAIESFQDSMTLFINAIFALAVPVLVVFGVVRPATAHATTPAGRAALTATLATYLLIVGLLPASGSVGIAAGVFAGEKQQGNLAPLLATPASNLALFTGKILGSILPTLLYAAVAVIAFMLEVIFATGAATWTLVPATLILSMLALVPTIAVFGAAVASVISSRVSTYNTATTLASLALVPLSGTLLGLAFIMPNWAAWLRFLAVLAVIAIDVAIVIVGASTWRREEVLARS
ncbi:MAG TPA: hypothetical protein VIG30_04220 [Ktedonobacterales bacterium]|jgi:ABC-type Na+ efflux pump permease subunit